MVFSIVFQSRNVRLNNGWRLVSNTISSIFIQVEKIKVTALSGVTHPVYNFAKFLSICNTSRQNFQKNVSFVLHEPSSRLEEYFELFPQNMELQAIFIVFQFYHFSITNFIFFYFFCTVYFTLMQYFMFFLMFFLINKVYSNDKQFPYI